MTGKKGKIGDHFLHKGLISEEQLSKALEHQKDNQRLLGEVLIDKGYASAEDVAKVLAEHFNLPFVSLKSYPIDETLKTLFPVKKMKQWKVFPVKLENDILTVAVANPLDLKMIQELKYLSAYKISLAMATPDDIFECINHFFGSTANIEEALAEAGAFKDYTSASRALKTLEEAVKDAPIVKLVNSIITEAIHQGASDIHLEPQRNDLRVRYRVDGVLHEAFIVPQDLKLSVTSRIKIICGMDIAEMRKPQDGRMSFDLDRRAFDIRASTLPDSFGEKVVLRILDKESLHLNLQNLGLDKKETSLVESLIRIPYGILLITGPTGSGKTTSLYSMISQLNDETRNIVTVENPVEYQIDGINQTEVNEKAGYGFATGLRHILRQDPDVIMIGEIRDLETAEIAIQAALTGHLVLSTLHTNNASGSIVRLIDMNVEPFLIGASVCGIIAQRLLRKLCPHCAKEEAPSPETERIVSQYAPELKNAHFAKPVGCKQCLNLGYKGRTGIFEIMRITPEVKELILKRATETEIEKLAVAQGMRTLQMRAIEKAAQKLTSLEEAMRVTFIRTV